MSKQYKAGDEVLVRATFVSDEHGWGELSLRCDSVGEFYIGGDDIIGLASDYEREQDDNGGWVEIKPGCEMPDVGPVWAALALTGINHLEALVTYDGHRWFYDLDVKNKVEHPVLAWHKLHQPESYIRTSPTFDCGNCQHSNVCIYAKNGTNCGGEHYAEKEV